MQGKCAASRPSGAQAWTKFDRVDHILSPELKRLRAAEVAWFEAKEESAAGDEAAAARVPALKEEYDLAFVFSNSLMEHHFGVGKSGDGDDG